MNIQEILIRQEFCRLDRRCIPLIHYDPYWDELLSFWGDYCDIKTKFGTFRTHILDYPSLSEFETKCRKYVSGMRQAIANSPFKRNLIKETQNFREDEKFFADLRQDNIRENVTYLSLDLKESYMQIVSKLGEFNDRFEDIRNELCDDEYIRTFRRLNDAMENLLLQDSLKHYECKLLRQIYNSDDELIRFVRENCQFEGLHADEMVFILPDDCIGHEKFLAERKIDGFTFHIRSYKTQFDNFKIEHGSNIVYETILTKKQHDGTERWGMRGGPYTNWMMKLSKGLPVEECDKLMIWKGSLKKLEGNVTLLSSRTDIKQIS